MIPETNDAYAEVMQTLRSPDIVLRGGGIVVLATIQLDRDPTLHAIEVDDVPADAVLSTKLETRQAARTKYGPQLLFSVG